VSNSKGTFMIKNLVRALFRMFLLIVLTKLAYPQWEQTNWPASNDFFNLYSNQGSVFARTWDSLNGGRVFFSDDNGTNWAQLSSADSDIDILSIAVFDNKILAGTWNGFYQSALGDPNWEALEPDGIPDDTAIWSLTLIDNTLYAGAWGHVYKSTVDDPNTWTDTGTGIPSNVHITSIMADGNSVYAVSDSNGIYFKSYDDTNWAPVNSGLTDRYMSQLAVMDNKLFAITLKDGVFVSETNGTSWAADSSGLENINCLLAVNNLLFAGTDGDGVYISSNKGQSWSPLSSGLPANARVWSLAMCGDNIFAGTNSGIWRLNPEDAVRFTITATGSEGGTILPGGDVTVYEHGTQAFTITPALGYLLSDVLVDGSSVGALSAFTFRNVTANHTISAVFTAVSICTITAAAGNGGTISPSGTIMFTEGMSQVFTIVPLPGYEIFSVTVDGNSVGAVSAYTFTNITASHTISVVFEIAPYKIMASASNGGTISPSGIVEIWSGNSQKFTITPSEGYEIYGVFVDGVSIGAVTSYTFSSVGTDHTIIAVFSSLIKYQINCGGSDAPPYTADQYYDTGSTYSTTSTINTTGVTNPAPQELYQTERYGNVTYTFPNLTSGSLYKVRLHFAEIYQTASGSRRFNVAINGNTMLWNYDIYAETGARYKAIVVEYTTIANSFGQIVIQFTTVTDNAKISGIEIIREL
jgi:hypothetical protein